MDSGCSGLTTGLLRPAFSGLRIGAVGAQRRRIAPCAVRVVLQRPPDADWQVRALSRSVPFSRRSAGLVHPVLFWPVSCFLAKVAAPAVGNRWSFPAGRAEGPDHWAQFCHFCLVPDMICAARPQVSPGTWCFTCIALQELSWVFGHYLSADCSANSIPARQHQTVETSTKPIRIKNAPHFRSLANPLWAGPACGRASTLGGLRSCWFGSRLPIHPFLVTRLVFLHLPSPSPPSCACSHPLAALRLCNHLPNPAFAWCCLVKYSRPFSISFAHSGRAIACQIAPGHSLSLA